MTKTAEPAAVELAPLPREQIGPFILLGVEKDSDDATIDAFWARCVLLARRNQTKSSLTDIHWAREVLHDAARRLQADADSLNADTARGDLRKILRKYRLDGAGPNWKPADPEPLVEVSEVKLPDPIAEAAAIPMPDIPLELPSVAVWLEDFGSQAQDPWGLYFADPPPDP